MVTDQILPEAFYDTLSLAHKLDDYLDGFRDEEIHLFAYFSLLLFLYKKNSLVDWRYKFTINREGYPFSACLNDSIQLHIRNGIFETQDDFYKISTRGVDEFNRFKNMELFKKREEFLNTACTASIAVPYSLTRKALRNEPGLIQARQMNDKRWIIDDNDQMHAYRNFAEISKKIGIDVTDLLIPAVTWINYLNEQAKENLNGYGSET
jgi:hypothetical protein